MVGGRLRCLTCFFTYSVVLLVGVCLHDVDASCGKRTIHKKVGDTVEFSSCLSSESVTFASWTYQTKLDETNRDVTTHPQFQGRVVMNNRNYILQVRKLTLQDSGDFLFVSEVNETQRPTVIISLQVHKPITKQPVLKVVTREAVNESCVVLLECSATPDNNVTYSWTVGNQTTTGSKLKYVIREHDGETHKFTCTISNFISEKSAFETVICSNSTNFVLILCVAGGSCVMIVIAVGIAVGVCHCKQRQGGGESNDLTVYADISDTAIEDGTMKPCSVYETIDNRVNSASPGPQTVYDKIQFKREREGLMSSFQEIS